MAEEYLNQLMKQLKEKSEPETENEKIPDAGVKLSGTKKISQIEEEIIVSEKNADESFVRAPTYSAETVESEAEEKQKIMPAQRMSANDALSPLKKEISEGSEPIPDAAEKTTAEKEVEKSQKIELKSYGKVKIFRIPEKPLPYYFIPTPRPTSAERKIINTIKEATTRLISIAPYKVRDPEQRRIVYKQKIIEILKNSPSLKVPESRINFYAEAVVREMVGYGIIDDLIKDDQLEEIMVIGPKQPIYVFHREFEMMSTNIEFFSEQEIEDLVNKIAREVGRRVDVSAPLLDARLPDGSRVNATIPPASISGGTLTIRKFKADPYSIIDLIKIGTISSEAAAFLWLCVEGMNVKPANILISGGTGSGKTTLLNILTAFVPERERVITIEDTAELSLPLKHWIRMEARPPGLEGTGELKMDILTKNSLRMRPDRIIVGEVRHEEAFTLFTALNTGHDGCMGTVHANSPQETIIRVTNPPMNVPKIMLSGLDMIIIEHRLHDRKKGTIRRITEMAEVYNALEGDPKTETIYKWDPVKDSLERTLVNSKYVNNLQIFSGLNKEQINAEINIRKTFLDELTKQNIRSILAVSSATKKFLEKRAEASDLK